MISLEDMRKFVELAEMAQTISKTGADPEVIYGLIFSPEISRKTFALDPGFSYYDPDASYEEDVEAFVSAVTARAESFKKVLGSAGVGSALERRAYNAGFAAGSASDERLRYTYEEWLRIR